MPDKSLSGEFVLSKEKPQEVVKKEEAPKAQPSSPSSPPPAPASTQDLKHNHEHTNMRFFSSLGHYPKNVTFLHQDADEEVVLIIRRDFITNLPWILSFGVAALVPPLVAFFAPFFFPSLSISATLALLTVLFYYLVLFGFVLLYFTIWYFNVGIVTNKRIIDVDVPNILIRELSEARINTIQDISYTQIGGIRSIFDYGNIDIQTEALRLTIEFDRAPSPNFIRKVIGDLIVDKPTL